MEDACMLCIRCCLAGSSFSSSDKGRVKTRPGEFFVTHFSLGERLLLWEFRLLAIPYLRALQRYCSRYRGPVWAGTCLIYCEPGLLIMPIKN